jgi:hypothetical protein
MLKSPRFANFFCRFSDPAEVKYAVGCTSGFGDFTYRKPNRRQPQGGALLPAHVNPIPRVTVIVDTSGSMEQSDLALALGVIGNALRSLPDPRGLRVLACLTQSGAASAVPKWIDTVLLNPAE